MFVYHLMLVATLALVAGRLSAPARAALQGMFNEARGRMDEAQQWYEGTMEKAALDQGALKRQIAQVLPF
jgi:hypothetical protein